MKKFIIIALMLLLANDVFSATKQVTELSEDTSSITAITGCTVSGGKIQ